MPVYVLFVLFVCGFLSFLLVYFSHVVEERNSQCGCATLFCYGETSGGHELDSIGVKRRVYTICGYSH